MKVLVIIPCFNEAGSIVDTVESLKSARLEKGVQLDYVVINDGSTDDSRKKLRSHGLEFIDLPVNLGIGAAIQTGYKYALEGGYDIAVQFDGDGQHDATSIEDLIAPIVNHTANFVIGSRFIDGAQGTFQSTRMRRFGNAILSRGLKAISGKKIKDMTSGFRAADEKVIRVFAKNYPQEYPEPVTNLWLAKGGYKIVEIPAKMKPREHGKSSITPFKSAYYMANMMILFLVVLISGRSDFENE